MKQKPTKNCIVCNKEFERLPRRSNSYWETVKYCSLNCFYKTKIGKATPMFGQVSPMKGKKHKEISKLKMSKSRLGKIPWDKGKKRPEMTGEKHWAWKSDRTSLQRYADANRDRRSSAYRDWRKKVWLRDNFKCKIANPDCKGRIEVHHILGWTAYPELRYEVNNGITLCHAHHPRKRSDEAKLSPYFQQLVAENK